MHKIADVFSIFDTNHEFRERYILKIGEKIISKNGYDNTEIQTNRQNPLNTNRML